MTKRIAVLGRFAFGSDATGGQITKTRVIGEELVRRYGEDDVALNDTKGGFKALLTMPFTTLRLLRGHQNVVVMPSRKGILAIIPLFAVFNLFFRRKLHYVVIGGWLPQFAAKHPFYRWALKRFHHIYVETHRMLDELSRQRISNTVVLPNCKKLDICPVKELFRQETSPLPLCTFSRVNRQKGIGIAIEAVKKANEALGKEAFTLDIFGNVEEPEWFHEVLDEQTGIVKYKGTIAFDKSTAVLSKYYLLLFPTYYDGEGFPGTLIDALAAGVPAVASNWMANAEIVDDGKTGFIVEPKSADSLAALLVRLAQANDALLPMRMNCIEKAADYQPEHVVDILAENI